MVFTKKNSINDILNTSSIQTYLKILFAMQLLEVVPENLRDAELEEVEKKVKMPWGDPFLAGALIDAANMANEIVTEKKYRFVPLWEEETEDYIPHPEENNKKSVFLLVRNVHSDQVKPAVIVCPGGGYELVAANEEGIAVADRMETAGYRPFVLYYRVNPNHYPEPQKDLAVAVKYVRANAKELGIDPDRVMLIGSSAGGHLCASFAALHGEIEEELMKDLRQTNSVLAEKYQGVLLRPNMLCLNYPVISFVKEAHEESFQALTGGGEELREKLSVELQVGQSYPKTFVWACEDDAMVPVSNAIRMGEALEKCGVPCRLKVYPTGGHGCGLAYGTSAEGWIEEMLKFMK